MKPLILSLYLLISTTAFSQSFYLGRSPSIAISLIEDGEEHISGIHRTILDNGNICFGWENEAYREFLFFNGDNISEQFCLVPKSSYVLNLTISRFNNDYVKLSDDHWKLYSNGNTYNIRLTYVKNEEKYAFYISISE